VGSDEQYRTHLKVRSADGAVVWTAWEKTSQFGLGYTTPQPFHWSQDGRYLYFTNLPAIDGCAPFVDGSDLQRLDLTDGDVVEILPNVGSTTLSLSPDEKTLVYTRDDELVLRSVPTAKEQRLKIDIGVAGSIVWSPDGEAFMYALAIACDVASSIVRVDMEPLVQTTLVREYGGELITLGWPETGKVLLKDWDGNYWWMNAATGELTPATNLPTATP
jgi:sugar lactone lactonase YvrE